jgi:hypothetical protein
MIKQWDPKIKKEEKANPHLERKTYTKPKLIEHGQVEKLTQGATGRRRDTGGTRRR